MGNPAFFENAPEYDFYEKSAMGSRSSQECLDGTLFIFNNNKKKPIVIYPIYIIRDINAFIYHLQ